MCLACNSRNYLLKIHFNIILPSKSVYPKWWNFRFPDLHPHLKYPQFTSPPHNLKDNM